MKRYIEVYRFNVEDNVSAGFEVYVLDKENYTIQTVNYLSYATVLKMIGGSAERFYFWKEAESKEDTEVPQEVIG